MKVANLIIEKLSQNFIPKTTCVISLREHGVLPPSVRCPECHTPCKLGLTVMSSNVTAKVEAWWNCRRVDLPHE